MAIQVWDGTKYVGAELAKFGPSGTLKEALVWDGTQYVKVWPTSTYPATGSWSGTVPDMSAPLAQQTWATHTLTEAGTFTISATVTAPVTHAVSVFVNGDSNNTMFTEFGDGAVIGSATATFPVGTRLDFITYGLGAGTGTGSWSITKN